MKEEELRVVAKCRICGKPIGHTGLPLFWRVRVRRYGIKIDAIKRQDGLAAFLGGHTVLAQVMGTNEDMADQISEIEVTLCETCGNTGNWPIAAIAEEER